jgi:LuxR family maltose regulon positive regulatory protein
MPDDETITLIQTKLDPPPISSDLITRPRLLDYLNHDLDRKFTLISAPAGYGKSVLLAQWLHTLERPLAWLSLDEHDNDFNLFLTYFLGAIRKLYPLGVDRTLTLLRAPSQTPPDEIATMLVNDVSEIEESFILALDDYHTIEDPNIGEFITYLVAHLPQNLHLVIATRRDPPLPLPRLRASWTLKEIRGDALRFTRHETTVFLESIAIDELTKEDMVALEQRTEGWIVGLRLFALSLQGTNDREGFIRGFQNTAASLIVDYLTAEVLESQEPEVQEFLLSTSILDRYCTALCDAVLESASSQSILDQLIRTNLFVIPLDQEHKWYRYHHLFQDLLQRRLRESKGLARIQSLHKQASSWLANESLIDEALLHALAAGEMGIAAGLVEQHRVSLLNSDDWRTLQRWIAMLPKEAVADRPALLLAQAWISVYYFDQVAIQSLLKQASQQLQAPEHRLPPDEIDALQGEIDALYSYFWQTFDSKVDLSLAHAEQALEHLPQEYANARGLAQDFLATAYQTLGRLDDAVQLLTDMIGDPVQSTSVKTQAFIALCFVYYKSGDLHALSTTAAQYLSYASAKRRLSNVAWANYFLGLIAYERNDLQTAEGYLSAVVGLRRFSVYLTYHGSILYLAQVHWAMNQNGATSAILRKHGQELQTLGNNHFLQDVEALQAQFSMELDESGKALQWANRIDPETLVEPIFADEHASLPWSRVIANQGSALYLNRATEFLERRLALVESQHNTRRQIKVLAQLSLVYAKSGQADIAISRLKRGLALAEPNGFIRAFVDLGSEMFTLLGQIAAAETMDESLSNYVSSLLTEFPALKSEISPKEISWQRAQAIMPDPLTKRESEVLLLLAKRLKYREIAQSLFISMPTTKKHISHIYAKLGAKNRAEAIEKANSLDILQ